MKRQIIEGQELLVDRYEDFEEKGKPSEDIAALHFRRIQQIPVLTDAEEQDLLQRWCEFRDENAREQIVRAHLRMVPPIARAAAHKAGLEPSKGMGRAAWTGFEEKISDLTAAGNLGLMLAIGGYRLGQGAKFGPYARQCIRREIWKQATFLRSAVRRKDNSSAIIDLSIDPDLPDVRHVHDNVGTKIGVPTSGDNVEIGGRDRVEMSAPRTRLAHREEPKVLTSLDHLIPVDRVIIRARLDGMSLAEIAERLGVSAATIWRKEQRAIARIKAHGNPDTTAASRDSSSPRDNGIPL